MKFRATQSIIVGVVIVLAAILTSYFNSMISLTYILVVLLLSLLLYGISSDIEMTESRVIKRSFFYKKEEIEIKDITTIDAVTNKKFGHIYIHIGKSKPEDYYILYLKNNKKITVKASFKNNGTSVGRYLKSKYNIQFHEVDKIKYIYNP
jgi:hypothetical protein